MFNENVTHASVMTKEMTWCMIQKWAKLLSQKNVSRKL